jgi:SAM-dependent methyltransferase
METHSYPEFFARFYDRLYDRLRKGIDHAFFLDRIRGAKGPVLEAGTGTGRLFLPALRQGADMYGFDISESMLNRLRSKLEPADHYRISVQNIVDFQYKTGFDLIIAPFRVFQHLLEVSEQITALNNVYAHLNPGGIFIFDAFVPDLNILQEGLHDVVDFDGEYEPGRKLKRMVSSRADLIAQQIHVTFHLEWDEDNRVNKRHWSVPMRFFWRYELEHLLERSAFGTFEILGDYHGNKLSEESREFIVECKK